jgi:hypothetical protein
MLSARVAADPVAQPEAAVAASHSPAAVRAAHVKRRPVSVVCLTPVKNEAWILERFLSCASLWADHIIIADQGSTDGSREIACAFPKVILLENSSDVYDEAARQDLLIQAARQFPGPRLLLALDADEMLTANCLRSVEWQALLQAQPGSVLRFEWVNVLPGFQSGWIPPGDIPFGFSDDGSEHGGGPIHNVRIPVPAGAATVSFRDIKVLHYQYTDWQRMKSKQRWYQCWEAINNPSHRAVGVYRQYHRADAIAPETIHPLPSEWLCGYQQRGIDMTTVRGEGRSRFDEQTLGLFRQHGLRKFRRVDIWDVDWQQIAEEAGGSFDPAALRDPRSRPEKLVHRWLRSTQRRYMSPDVRIIQRVLKMFGW